MLRTNSIGRRSESRKITLERGQMKLFAKAISETNPIYFDEVIAQEQGYPDIIAAPTFGTSLRLLAPSIELSYESLGIDYQRLLHAEESFEYFFTLYAGDEVVLVGEVADVFERKAGQLQFIVIKTHIHKNTQLAQTITSTLVMKEERS